MMGRCPGDEGGSLWTTHLPASCEIYAAIQLASWKK